MDAVFDTVLSERERRLVATVPALVENGLTHCAKNICTCWLQLAKPMIPRRGYAPVRGWRDSGTSCGGIAGAMGVALATGHRDGASLGNEVNGKT
ncbi:MAG: hypothetical protein IPH35_23535 [Rhodoferax sp.]|nr:hypothetical protein [Rhodoferax sp.]